MIWPAMTWKSMIRKTLIYGLLAACFPLLVHAAGPHKPFQVYDFSKGLDTYHNPTTLPDGFVQNSLNVLFDSQSPVQKRSGYTVAWSTKSYSFTGLWTYTDATNTTWQLARSSDQITASNLAGSVIKVATVSVNNLVGEANAFGNAYFADQTQGVYYWNGSSTTFIAGSPKGSILSQFHNRLWVAGAAVPNGNQLYGSAYYNASIWATGINDTDPVQYSIGLQDNFDNVTAEYVYLDTLYLFKHYSIFALYGFGQSTFQISQLTQECGCVDGNTIQTYNGGLKFVSLRGVEDFNGYACNRISDPIKNLVDPAIQTGGFSQQSWVQSAQSDWNAGTFNASNSLSSSISPPSLVLSNGTFTDNTGAAFGLATTTVGIDTASVSNVVTLKTFLNDSFSSMANYTQRCGTTNASSNDADMTSGSIAFETVSSVIQTGDILLQFDFRDTDASANGESMEVAMLDSPTVSVGYGVDMFMKQSDGKFYLMLVKEGWNNGSGTCNGVGSQDGFVGGLANTSLSYDTSWHTVELVRNNTTGAMTVYLDGSSKLTATDTTFSSSSFGKFAVAANQAPGLGHFHMRNAFAVARTGNITSNAKDSTLTNPVWGVWNATANGVGTITYSGRTSTSSSSSYQSDVAMTAGSVSGVNNNEFFIYSSTITAGTSVSSLPQLQSVGTTWTASSGTFQSQIHNVGTMNSWGNFSAQDALNGGTIAFSICGSTNSNLSPPQSCANQTPNSQITISTEPYVEWFATFTVTAASQTPTLQSGSLQWFTGSVQVPMASTIWDNRYWLSLTTTTADNTNDAVLVLNHAGAWAVFDIHAGAFTQYKNSLYHADSTGTGNIYLDNQRFADNGNPINAFVRTKTESMGDLASNDYMYVLYPAASNTGNCSMSVQYVMDKSTNTYSLGSPLLSEYGTMSSVRLPFPVDSSHMDFGQSIDFTIGTDDATCDWQFYGLEGLYKMRPVQ